MCGRYTSTSTLEDLVRVFEVEEVRTAPLPDRYNVAPTLDVYAVALRNQDKGPRRALGTFRWGLIPSWAKERSIGSKMINARAEGLETKAAYRSALARRRCLIPADAFYEWQRRTHPDGRPAGKLPYAIRRADGQPMAFAGLWEVWRDPADPDGDLVRTCAIVTTAANDLLAPVHDRMPAVLDPADWDTWLDRRSDPDEVKGLLVPAPSEWFEIFPVSSLVSNVANDGPELLQPLLSGAFGAPADASGAPADG
jgi:putative SOS response-associated peptidase YedK